MKAKFAIDVDDTLYDFGAEVREAFFEMAIESGNKDYLKGAYSGFHEWRDLSDVFEWDTVYKAIQWVHDRQLEHTPYKNAVKVVKLLSEEYHIKYVTSRYDHHEEKTASWLSIHGFPMGDLICSTHDKTDHISDCQYIIDDRPKTIVDFVTNFTWKFSHGSENKEKRRMAFGLWTPYNRNLTDIKGIYLAPTWRGIEFYLRRKKVLGA